MRKRKAPAGFAATPSLLDLMVVVQPVAPVPPRSVPPRPAPAALMVVPPVASVMPQPPPAGLSEPSESAASMGPQSLPLALPVAAVLSADGHRARMRARLLAAGPDALNEQDLLEMLLFLALPRRDTKSIVRLLLARFGGFAGVVGAPVPELLAVEGLGEAGAAALKTVQAAALRLLRGKVLRQPVLANWDRLLEYLTALLAHERVEQFRVLFLDSRNRVLADEAQGQGTVNRASVFPREVARRALELHATAVILVHNHPTTTVSITLDHDQSL
jgi:DNA repair protein RadC